jgi:hypothetical protein
MVQNKNYICTTSTRNEERV